MSRKANELPPEAAKAFVRDMRAFFRHETIKADDIAANQLHGPTQHCNGKLRLTDVKAIFLVMKSRRRLCCAIASIERQMHWLAASRQLVAFWPHRGQMH